MHENYYVMEKAKRYLELQEAFGRIFVKINSVLDSYPSSGITLKEGSKVSKNVDVLGHECEFEFGAVNIDGMMVGVVRLLDCKIDEGKQITEIYFDKRENWRIEKDLKGWMYNFGYDEETTNQ